MSPKKIISIESTAILIASLVVFNTLNASWWLFIGLLLVPDLFMVGYLRNRRLGALVYNIGHSYIAPALLVVAGLLRDHDLCIQLATIWVAHIAMDRAFGYGLKLQKGFKHTHLGTIGK